MAKPIDLLLMIALCASGCSGTASPAPVGPSSTSAYAGEFHGSTSQGQMFVFTVTRAERVIDIAVGYRMGDCWGLVVYTSLSVEIKPPQSGPGGTPDGPSNPTFTFTMGTPGEKNSIDIAGEFTSTEAATGTARFNQYRGCADGVVTWAATKR